MCGEHQSIGSPPPGLAGSSPRVRGTRSFDDPVHRQRGIIPACAGNTDTRDIFPLGGRDHPRVCGEHWFQSGAVGSFIGIIPACAGNTTTSATVAFGSRDHPRVCGEHAPPLACLFDARGSSPRVRGTHGRHVQNRTLAGIIPACAGNTPAKAASPSRNRDHPRVCGEHELPELRQAAIRGSSPRVRGTPDGRRKSVEDMGIIPACAGNTVRWMSW